jgi:putative phage-type endonuclease
VGFTPREREGKHLALSKLPSVINEIQDAVLLGDFENGSPEWHELRNEPGAIGGSDIAAIAGLSQWESAYTKWAKKTKQIPDSIEPSMSMRLGTKLEAPILEIFSEEHPELELYTTGTWANKEEPWMRANPDALYSDESGEFGILEIKFSRDYWTAVPQSYRAQVLWYMRVFGLRKAKLVALAGSSYQEFEIEWDQFEADTLFGAAIRFRNHVVQERAPQWDGSTSTLETVKKLNPHITDGEVDLDDLGMHYFNKLDEYERVEKELTELKSRVLAAMQGNKRGLIYGEHRISLRARGAGLPYLHHEKIGK